jgi:predicted metal-dependent HD superfamily phosphohydrolase
LKPKNNAFIGIAKALYRSNALSYHNLDHIDNMLFSAERLSISLTGKSSTESLVIAIWYHDVVSDTRRLGNEKTSEELFLDVDQALSKISTFHDFSTEKVCRLIGLTSKHLVELDESKLDDDDCIMLDADLAGFGNTSFVDYLDTSSRIRNEYPHLSDDAYKTGRIRFLSKLADKNSIFYTEPARNHWEVQARLNIEQELEVLKTELKHKKPLSCCG